MPSAECTIWVRYGLARPAKYSAEIARGHVGHLLGHRRIRRARPDQDHGRVRHHADLGLHLLPLLRRQPQLFLGRCANRRLPATSAKVARICPRLSVSQ